MDKCEVLEKLTVRTISYLKINLGLKEISGNFKISCVDTLEHEHITRYVSLGGDRVATVGLSVSYKFAAILVRHSIFGQVSDESVEELATQTVEEILNIVLGNIIQELNVVKNGGDIEISTPYENMEKINGEIYISKIQCSGENMILSCFHNENFK